MVTASARVHVDALAQLVAAAGLVVFVTRADEGASYPYVVLHPTSGQLEATSLEDPYGELVVDFQLTAVGETPEQALWAADKAAAALAGARPTVAGRTSWAVTPEEAFPVQRDEDLTEPVFFAVNRYSWRTS